MGIGKNISQIRKDRGLTIKDVATMAGVTPSLISQIENDKANPSLSTMLALAKALSTDITSFFDGKDKGAVSSSSPVVRASERVRIDSSNSDEWATYLLTNRNFEKFCANTSIIKPGADSANYPEMHPENLTTGYEFGFVISGKLQIQLDGDIYILNAGDSICFEATKKHRLINNTNSDVTVLWVDFSDSV